MKTFKDIGITFKQIKINEADIIFSILTKYHGRIDAIAKSIRKLTSRKAGNIDLVYLSRFSFVRGENLDIITEAELVDDYKNLKKKLNSTFQLFYICELIDNFIQSGEEQNKLFHLVIELLHTLEISKSKLPLRSFELKLITEMGFEPNLKTCLNCGRPFVENDKKYLSVDKFGFFCSREKSPKGRLITNKILKSLKFLHEHDIKSSNKLKTNKILDQDVFRITKQWIENITEKEIKSEKYM
ncbi:DNA repair protein RecO [Candidatus Dojkabacteria bacterium]|nr:DNA repair protein RecO [Candidatus Dojkabacteria bacterium]